MSPLWSQTGSWTLRAETSDFLSLCFELLTCRKETVMLVSSVVKVKMIQDDAQHVVSLTSPQQKLALLFLDQHLPPVEDIALGSLAVVLNRQ